MKEDIRRKYKVFKEVMALEAIIKKKKI